MEREIIQVMFKVTASVEGSLENRHWSTVIPSGTNSGIEVLVRDMAVSRTLR